MSNGSAWLRCEAWDGIAMSGRTNVEASPGITIVRREGIFSVAVIGREGEASSLKKFFAKEYDAELPQPGKCALGQEVELVWSAPVQWFVVSRDRKMPAKLYASLKSVAAVSDQSDSRAILRLSGSYVREVLAKGCLIDLHPQMFGPGSAITTSIAGIGAQIWWANFDSAVNIAVARSMAESFWSWLVHSAAEYGVEVTRSAS